MTLVKLTQHYLSLTPNMRKQIEEMALERGLSRAGMVKQLLQQVLENEQKTKN